MKDFIKKPYLRKLYFYSGIAVSVLSLWIAFDLVAWDKLKSALRDAEYVWLLPSAFVIALAALARAERWRWLMGGHSKVSLPRSFRAVSIGYLITNIFPFRLGELVRPVIVARGGKVKAMHSFSTIAVEHVLDLLMIFGMLIIVLPDIILPQTAELGVARGAVLFTIVSIGLIIVVWQRTPVERAFSWIIKRIPGMTHDVWEGRFHSFMKGLAVIGSPRLFSLSLLWTVIAWILSAVGFHLALLAFVPDAPFVASLLVTVTVALARLAPATPGSIGVIQIVIQQSLIIFGIAPGTGLAFGLVFHATEYIVLNVAGVISLAIEGMSWSSLVSTVHETEAQTGS
jgi:uncharacterized protein (TIRG00374 family)